MSGEHECSLPNGPYLGLSGASPVWVCPECGIHWQYIKPFGMYAGWRAVEIGPLLKEAYPS